MSQHRDLQGLVAIIGIGCRFPGIDGPDAFFQALAKGRDCITRESPADDGRVRAFGRIDGIEDFDADVFRFIPRHAELLAPEQRLLLECGWWALEDAGYAPGSIEASVGVYAAAAKPSYRQGPLRHPGEWLVADSALGQDYAATRLSYKLNLKGPSLSIQTASSASLVAINMACEALLSGQCDMALAGGASVSLPQDGYRYDPSLMLSKDGVCRPFDAAASGAVPGNGAALVLLKPLADALRDGDNITAVICAGAVNNDGGHKVDFYAPAQAGQEAVIREALAMAGLSPGDIGYIEAHGTGTPLGDPIELAALAKVFPHDAVGEATVAVGSVKSSIGHLHTAAGVAGLVKAALMLREKTLCPSLHYTAPNPQSVLAERSAFRVVTSAAPWPAPASGAPRRAGVSSFGIGGTNAHVILEEAPPSPARADAPGWHIVPLSARTPEGLEQARHRLAQRLEARPDLTIADIAFTLQTGRVHFAHRCALAVSGVSDLVAALCGKHVPGAPDDLAALAHAFENGETIRFPAAAGAQRVALPVTVFDRKRFWITQDAVDVAPQITRAPVATTSAESMLADVRQVIASQLGRGIDSIDPTGNFAGLGIESVLAPLLAAALSETTGRDVRPYDFYDYPTPARLADELRLRDAPSVSSPAAAVPAPVLPEAIAIIGMAGRFPGAENLDQFWDVIRSNRVTTGPLPAGLWPGSATAHGGLIPGYQDFDAGFFRVSPREARLIDPQQRVFLEECWKALDDAGLHAEGVAGRRIGVYAGAQAGDYPVDGGESHSTIGTSLAVLAARVAYVLDLKGPALTVDTACSSALTAVHLAMQALRARDCEVALAGGVSISLPYPRGHGFFQDAGLLSPRGSCRPFCADADGIVPADGVGVVVLKRLSDATRDGDRIYGIIRASGMNQDGQTNGITAPNGPAQRDLIRALYQDFAIDPTRLGFVECHGTGTRLGDPIELEALSASLGPQNCAIGSVKANIGHTLPAAGIAGLLKLLLAIEARTLPPDLSAGSGSGPFRRLARPEPWADEKPLAAVSAFGFGGTNAHLVVEAPRRLPSASHIGSPLPFMLSAPDPACLQQHAADLSDWLIGPGSAASLADIAWTLSRRAPFACRAAFAAADRQSLLAGLEAIAQGSVIPSVNLPQVPQARLLRLPPHRFQPQRFWFTRDAAPASAPLPEPSGQIDQIQRLTAELLMLEPHDVAPDSGFAALGLDSILAAELAQRINASLGTGIKAIDFYNNPTPARLTAALAALARPVAIPAPTPQPEAAPAPAVAAAVIPEGDRKAAIVSALASALYVEPGQITGSASFVDLGLDSILAVEVAKTLSTTLKIPVRAMDFYEAGTLDRLSALLAASQPAIMAAASASATAHDAIAIIGIAGRFPGAPDIPAFWDVLSAGRDCVTEIPPGRWPLEGFFDPQKGKGSRSYSRWGGFIDGIDCFDPLHFRISPREAELMDPQERLFLTCVQAALDDAACLPQVLGGGKVGVFAGVMYGEWQLVAADASTPDSFIAAHAPYWSIANRVSYCFGWTGPSMAIDSACSSALTALHLACESLRRGECAAAVAGGVNLSLHPRKYLGLSAGRFAATDGRCRSFGTGGDGYVPGEGVGTVVLKRLADAIADGDHIHGVIRASAINHGGTASGYSVPQSEAQAEVIREALRKAGLEARSISYVEAHGTGTALGDPIELEGLKRAFGAGAQGISLGSVKSNIGHLEAAAGAAALAKVLLQMQHRQLAPSLHSDPPNPVLEIDGSGFAVVRQLTDWSPRMGEPLRAGISSFGAGGSNAHVIVEEAPALPERRPAPPGPWCIPLSAPSPEQLARFAAAIARHIRHAPASSWLIADLAHTLAHGRTSHAVRHVIMAQSTSEALALLDACAAGAATAQNAPLPPEVAAWLEGGASPLPPVPGARRIALPPLPLNEERYWLPQAPTPPGAPKPLRQARDSLAEAVAASGETTLSWSLSDPVLSDHRVQGRAVLPAAALLIALARQVRSDVSFSDVSFLSPLPADATGLAVTVARGDDGLFTVFHNGKPAVRGRITMAAAPPQNSPAATAGDLPDAAALYARFDAMGTCYGPAYRRIGEGLASDGEVRARLKGDGPAEGLLDAGFHAAALLMPEREAHLPFHIESLWIATRIGEASFARLLPRHGSAQLGVDLTLSDAAGDAVAVLHGLSLRPIASAPMAAAENLALLAPVWREEPLHQARPSQEDVAVIAGPEASGLVAALTAGAAPGRLISLPLTTLQRDPGSILSALATVREIIFITGHGSANEDLHTAEATGVMPLLSLLQGLARLGAAQKRVLRLVTFGVQATGSEHSVSPWQAAAIGLAKVAGLELPGLSCALIDLPPAHSPDELAGLAAAIRAEPATEQRIEIALRNGHRLVQRVERTELPAAGFNPFRPWGVHVIVGGARGIGLQMACHMARQAHARVLLIGRSDPANAEAAVAAVAAAGGEAIYRSADLLDAAAVASAVAEARHLWGPINGVIHSAIVLDDRSLLRLDAASFRRALDPKARGAVNLAAAVAQDDLDYFAFFSSANAVFGNAGQANYVAGCRFKDAFAAYLRTSRSVPALSINWGYWGEVGVVADDAMRDRLARQGILPISNDEGIGAFERALCAGVRQIMPVAGTAEAFARLGVTAAAPSREDAEEAALQAIEAEAAVTLQMKLAGMGFVPGVARSARDWADLCRVSPGCSRLFEACLHILGQHGLAEQRGGAWSAVAQAEPRPARTNELPAHRALFERALACLPEVLGGKMTGVAALMPAGSSELVARIYTDSAVVSRLNDSIAAAVLRAVGGRPAGQPLRIIEVGGGTGSATAAILPGLAAAAPATGYVFTDISPAFLPPAQARFGSLLAGFTTARLDISEGGTLPPADIVVASNVIHATPDLRQSLGSCRALLKDGGLLVLNEATSTRDFATLTFGLTEGWWRATDLDVREPHGPAAPARRWRTLLAEAGFTAIRMEPESGDAPQVIITAEAARRGAETRDDLVAHVSSLLCAALKLKPGTVDPETDFGVYGLESVMALEIIAALEQHFGTLPKTLLFEANSAASLAAWLSANKADAARQFGSSPQATPATAAGREAPAMEDIAIIALAGRYPGARTPAELWSLLSEGRSAITEVPPERWNHAEHFDARGDRDDKAQTRFGGFVSGIDQFDAGLFNISPAEARAIDPMERQFIEIVWELFENAGHTPERLKRGAANDRGGDIGVFVGVMSQTYEQLATEIWAKGKYTGAFSSHSSIANRVSFLFDLTGPSTAVDTACSSSLSAIHMAAEAIRRGDCRAAIAGGVNLLMHPLHHILMSAYRVLSPDDKTRAFGAGGKGFVVGEGIGAILLRPLADAQRDGDPVLAVLKGSAINTCGRTSSYSAPSVSAQERVIRAAFTRAGLDPASVSYIEAHGTGTELGDPVEVRALTLAFAGAKPAGSCAIGSIKPNIGHLEAAAGVAGVSKVLLQLQHRALAPSLHALPPNPNINFAETPFRVQTALGDWRSDGGPRRAGISSFGLGGANAHIILEEAPAAASSDADDGAPVFIPVSARTDDRLRQHLARLRDTLRRDPSLRLRDVAWTLQAGRQSLAQRWACVVTSRAELLETIDGWLAGASTRALQGRQKGPASLLTSSDPDAVARHWVAGGQVSPEALRGQHRVQIVPLPNYPFEPRRFWLGEGDAMSRGSISASRAQERADEQAHEREIAQAPQLEPVGDYYDATIPVSGDDLTEAYFSLAPLRAPPPDFSWTRTVFEPDHDPLATQALLEGQRALRDVLLEGIDVTSRPLRVLDFGCGAGTDLIRLARGNPQLTGHGRTISAEHGRVASSRVRLAGLANRITIETGDSAGHPFPGPFDVIIGIEVAHHIENKRALLANLTSCLAPGGRIALADCLSPRVDVPSPATGSWTLSEAGYARLMAEAGLAITRAVDCSSGIANCLTGDDIDSTIRLLSARGLSPEKIELIGRVHDGWLNFGMALASGSLRYLLLQFETSTAPQAQLMAANKAALANAIPFGNTNANRATPEARTAAPATAPAAPTRDSLALVRSSLAKVIGVAPEDVDIDAAFVEQGVDSLAGLRFTDELARRLGAELGTNLIYDHPTPALLAQAIAAMPGMAAPDVPEAPAAAPVAVRSLPDNAVAVVGLATRLPGASDQHQFWDVLRNGTDCVGEAPASRWNTAVHWSTDPEDTTKTYGKWGGFIPEHDRFDAAFFGIAPREACYMDPQQRVFLETAWHALEDAGMADDRLRGSRAGVYAGLSGDEYSELMRQGGVAPDAYLMLGNAGSILAARLSYLLDLKGPALTVDTACSSSLVAVHLAAEAIRRGEIDLAVAGGVSLYLSEWPFKQMSRAGMLSPTGKCRSFAAGADGIVPAEGAAVVVLKPLTRAIADRDQIYGVILASDINQDGRSNGITAPSAAAQAQLIGDVLDRAGIDCGTIEMLEAHGTGTRIGDPIEAAGLVSAFAPHTSKVGFCSLGTVKSNIGHTTAASGAAGLAKALLALRNEFIPRSLHAEANNPLLKLDGSPFVLAREPRHWPRREEAPRRAAISSFGFSGTNAHMIVEEAPALPRAVSAGGDRLVTLSARSEAALARAKAALAQHLQENPSVSLPNLAYTLNLRRRHEACRAAFVVGNITELRSALLNGQSLVAGGGRDRLVSLAHAYLAGGTLDARDIDEGASVRTIPLPGYCFERERHWFTATSADATPEARDGIRLHVPRWREAAAVPAAIQPGAVLLALVNGTEELNALRAMWPGSIIAALPGQGDELDALLRDSGKRPDHVVDLWPLGATRAQPAAAQAARALHLLQTIHRNAGPAPVRVLIAHPQNTASGFGGLIASVPQALAGWTMSTLALDEQAAAHPVAAVIAELPRKAAEVRVKDGLRLERWPASAPHVDGARPIGQQGVVLISGGLGGIGRKLAARLAVPGTKLALLGRSPLGAEGEEFLATLRARGALARYWQVDVSNAPALQATIKDIRDVFGPLTIVHHLAGTMGSKPLATKDTAEAAAVLAAKIDGAVNLDAATRDDPLQAFVLHGSLGALVGDFGQGDYAMANAFLESFAETRTARGPGRSLTVSWPLWQDGGMKPSSAAAKLITGTSGLSAIVAEDAFSALEQALSGPEPVVFVSTGPLAELVRAQRDREPTRQAPPAAAAINGTLLDLAAQVVKLNPRALDPAASLLDQGFDSITLKEFASLLSRQLGRDLSPALFYQHGSLNEVAGYLAAEGIALGSATAPQPTVSPLKDDGAIAIIGMAGRLPGAPDLNSFWDVLHKGRDVVGPPAADRPGYSTARDLVAGYVTDADAFDAAFFQISPGEASIMDPQQRLFLEACWHALEDAGIDATSLAGSRTGVFVGAQGSDYVEFLRGNDAPQVITGLAHSAIPNRVSHWLDLRGPSLVIDTACASGLVALHRAATALRSGECALAISGAVNLLLSPASRQMVDNMGALSPDGRCKSFSAGADGYGRGEGVVALVMKPVAKAVADGDRILGVIRGSAEGHAGHAVSLTAPNPQAQADLLRTAWRVAGITTAELGYIEAHGTGTALGDPAEVDGIKAALGADGTAGSIGLGSVKSNIGHLEPASGLAGVVKTLLAFRHGAWPATLHCDDPNPLLKLDGSPLRLMRAAEAISAERTLAGVSAFGFTGAMAHAVIAPPPSCKRVTAQQGLQVLPFSARSAHALRNLATTWADTFERPDAPDLAAAASLLQRGRTQLEFRLAVVAADTSAAARLLRAWLAGAEPARADGVVISNGDVARRPFRAVLAAAAQTIAAAAPEDLALEFMKHERVAWPASVAALPVTPMPLYPFERRRYWARPATAPLPAAIDIDWSAFPDLAQHRVGGTPLMPASATAPVVAKASGRGSIEIRDISWLRPVEIGTPHSLHITNDAGRDIFEIRSGEGGLAISGVIVPQPPARPVRVDMAALQAGATEVIDGAELYRGIAMSGLQLGPGFAAITTLWRHGPAVLAALRAPLAETVSDAAVLDMAAQAGSLLLQDGTPGPLLPFAASSVKVMAGLSDATHVLAQKSARGGLDLAVLGPGGQVLAAVDGFLARPAAASGNLFVATPAWQADGGALSAAPDAGPVLIIHHGNDRDLVAGLKAQHPGATDRQIEDGGEIDPGSFQRIYVLHPAANGLKPAFGLARAIAKAASAPGSLIVASSEKDQSTSAAAGAAALFLSLGQEWKTGRVVVVDIAAGEASVAGRLARETAEPGRPLHKRYDGGLSQLRSFAPVTLPPATSVAPGAYLIIGGAGGLGSALAQELARTPGTRITLTGRRAEDGAIAQMIAALRKSGAEARYVQADVTDDTAMLSLVAALHAQHGALAGVIHAAIVLDNGPLATMSDRSFDAALAPKLTAVRWMEQAFRQTAPGYIAMFSSLIGFSGGAGQANYAAASAALDAAADELRSRLACPVKVIDWGFWGETGIVATAAERARLARQGMGALGTAEGLELFRKALASRHDRLVIARTLPAAETQPSHVEPARSAPALDDVQQWLTGIIAEILGRKGEALPVDEPFAILGVDSLVNTQILRALEAQLGALPRTLLFEFGTISALATEIAARHGEKISTPPQQQVQHVKAPDSHQDDGAVAIIGLSCRFPGAATPEDFWTMIRKAEPAFRAVPQDRWQAPAGARGAFLEGVDLFDPLHFSISFREAAAMDPQERLFLEVAWQTLEDAGYTRAGLRERAQAATGRDVGVYAGVMNGAFQLNAMQSQADGSPVQAIAPYWSIANRVSWLFDFHGPSMAVDTACSSSASALHLACEALRRGEIGAALVGGVSLLLHPRQFDTMNAMQMISPSGQCRPFCAGADGFLPGEGVGAVLLRPLRDARADGDRILGIIRGSAMNTGGRTSGYTVPSPAAQAEVVAGAIANAGVDPGSISYVEAHGTGTALGDPIEIDGLNRALGQVTETQRCAVGTVKALVGHLESAAAMAGLTRILMQFQHGEIAPTPLAGTVSGGLPLAGSRIELLSAPRPWQGLRRAGLSSFGAGGVNVHLIIDAPEAATPAMSGQRTCIVPLSARSTEQLREMAARLRDVVSSKRPDFASLAFTLQTGREAFQQRLAIVGSSIDDLVSALDGYLTGQPGPVLHVTGSPSGGAPGSLDAIAAAWVSGSATDWAKIWQGAKPPRISLPGYAFARERHWPAGLGPQQLAKPAGAAGPAPLHPFIAAAVPSLRGACFALRLAPDDPVLDGHRVGGERILPGMAIPEIIRAALGMTQPSEMTGVSNVAWLAPIAAGTEATLLISETTNGLSFEISSGQKRLVSGLISRHCQESRKLEVNSESLGPALTGPEIYSRMALLGVDYRGAFRGLTSLRASAQQAVADIVTPPAMPGLAWNPVLLDIAAQAMMGLLGASGEASPFVPFLVDHIEILAPLDGAAQVVIERRPSTANVAADIEILDGNGQVLVRLGNFQMRPRHDAKVKAETETPLEGLDRLAALRMFAQWHRTGVFAGGKLDPVLVMTRLRADPQHRQLLTAALDLFTRRGWIVEDAGTSTASPEALAEARDEVRIQRDLLQAAPSLAPHVELLNRCMSAFDGLMSGSIPATDVFFPGGSMELLTKVYAGDANAARLHAAAAELVAQDAALRPARPRLLEIGAGTGGTTVHVLDALRKAGVACDYLFTDISPRFLKEAQRRFEATDITFNTAVLDISREPAEQGLGGQAFDVIVASNVLHATPDMRRTMAHCVSLLAPGGSIVINEVTAARDYATLTFGLLKGWWLSADPEMRLPHAPLLSVMQWRELLASAGLEAGDMRVPDGLSAGGEVPQAVMVAVKAAPMAAARPPAQDVKSIEQILMEVVAQVFEMPLETVARGGILSFSELGGDSLLSAELATQLGRRLGVPLKTTAIFNFPTIPLLAQHIAEEYAAPAAVTPPATEQPAAAIQATPPKAVDDIFAALEKGEIDLEEALRRAEALA